MDSLSATIWFSTPHIQFSSSPLFAPRNKDWNKESRLYLKDHPSCIVCGGREYCVVHHVQPFHVFPEMEMNPANWVTLCEHPSHNDHLIFGHFLNWRRWNPGIKEMAEIYFNELVKAKGM